MFLIETIEFNLEGRKNWTSLIKYLLLKLIHTVLKTSKIEYTIKDVIENINP